jgi:aspartate/methionine/tyrosine aminotransferase
MAYDGESPSIATLPGMAERTVVVDGFSKTYAMTGWRLGFGVMPEALAKHMTALMNNSNSCTATFVQMAGEAALTGPQDEVTAMLAEFRARREVIVNGLNAIPGVTCAKPAGAFYAFPHLACGGLTSVQLADQLLEQAGVVTIPGTGFGEGGEGHLRLSYANSRENLREGLRRMAEHLAPLAKR